MSELAPIETEMAATDSEAEFSLSWRQAKAFSESDLIPKAFQGKIENCLIAMNLAKRLGADPMMVLQNLDIIHGRPSFRASFLIACVNMSGQFSHLRFRFTGEGMDRECVAHCTERLTGEPIEGPPVSMGMARAEGWLDRNGSKWKTLPDLMLRYRSAAFFARTVCPEITLGLHTSEEVTDMEPIPRSERPAALAANAALESAVDVTLDDQDKRNPDDHPEEF